MRSVLNLALIICILFSFVQAPDAESITFKECDQIVRTDQSFEPFHVDPTAFLNEVELRALLRLLDEKYKTARVIDDSNLQYENPFSYRYAVELQPEIKIIRKHAEIDGNLPEEMIDDLFSKMLKQTLVTAKDNKILSNALGKDKKLEVYFTGLRYFLKSGIPSSELPLHRDEWSVLQSLVVLYRPEDLQGGFTKFAWPMKPYRDSTYVRNEKMLKHWQPEPPTNHLLVFDGAHAFHGASTFTWKPGAPEGKAEHRDLLAMIIGPAISKRR